MKTDEYIANIEYEFISDERITTNLKIRDLSPTRIIAYRDTRDGLDGAYEFQINKKLSLNDVLFSFDFKEWDVIKEKTIKQHIQERMEVFNLMPAEEKSN